MTSSPEGEGGVSQNMTNDDMMARGGGLGVEMTRYLNPSFQWKLVQSSIIKPSLEISLLIPKERIVTLRVVVLTVPGCNGPSTVFRSTTYAVLSRNQFCRELRAHGGGVAKK